MGSTGRLARRSVTAVLVGIVLCSSVMTGGARAMATRVDAAGGEVQSIPVRAAGVEVPVPVAWSRHAIPKRDLRDFVEAIRESEPAFAEMLDGMVASGTFERTRLLAIDPNNGDTLAVYVEPRTYLPTRRELVARYDEPDARATGIELVEVMRTRLGDGPAFRVTTRAELGGLAVRTIELLFEHGRALVNVSVTVDDDPDATSRANDLLAGVRPLPSEPLRPDAPGA